MNIETLCGNVFAESVVGGERVEFYPDPAQAPESLRNCYLLDFGEPVRTILGRRTGIGTPCGSSGLIPEGTQALVQGEISDSFDHARRPIMRNIKTFELIYKKTFTFPNGPLEIWTAYTIVFDRLPRTVKNTIGAENLIDNHTIKHGVVVFGYIVANLVENTFWFELNPERLATKPTGNHILLDVPDQSENNLLCAISSSLPDAMSKWSDPIIELHGGYIVVEGTFEPEKKQTYLGRVRDVSVITFILPWGLKRYWVQPTQFRWHLSDCVINEEYDLEQYSGGQRVYLD